MRNFFNPALVVISLLPFCACRKSADAEAGLAQTPEQAASQMEEAFSEADARTRELAAAASEALRRHEYEQAVVSLQAIRANEEITPDQRIAVYGSAVTLEARLIGAMEAGDKNAEQAYQLLKALKRD